MESKTGSGSRLEYESVLNVPQTPGSELAAALRAYASLGWGRVESAVGKT